MKIELKINTDTIVALGKLLEMVYDLPVSSDKRENIYKSIGYDLADKFSSKAKSLIKKANLFDNKTHKIKLKYHEAWALEEITRELTEIFPDKNPYRQTLYQKTLDQLNQKLLV